MPACFKLAGAEYPKTYGGVELDPLKGKSFLPLLGGKATAEEPLYFWEHEGNRAVRRGDWKLVALHKGDWELYNLAADPFETNNLKEDAPEKASSLLAKYDKWAEEHGVRPWPLSP